MMTMCIWKQVRWTAAARDLMALEELEQTTYKKARNAWKKCLKEQT
jgi:hypothetical protein